MAMKVVWTATRQERIRTEQVCFVVFCFVGKIFWGSAVVLDL